jgi:uncharacterized membrane protein
VSAISYCAVKFAMRLHRLAIPGSLVVYSEDWMSKHSFGFRLWREDIKKIITPASLFLIIGLIFGLFFIKTIPPFWGIDELTHFDRVYQISEGQLTEKKINDLQYGGHLPKNIVLLENYIYKDLIDNDHTSERPDVDNKLLYNNYTHQKISKETLNYAFTGSGAYSPIAYTPPALGVVLGRMFNANFGQTLFLARLFTLTVYLKILKNSKAQWIIFTLGLLPMTIFQASIVSVDSLAMGLSFVIFSLLIRNWPSKRPLSGKNLVILALLGVLLSLTKPPYILVLLPIFLLPTRLLPTKHPNILRLGLMVLTPLPALIWNFVIRDALRLGGTLRGKEFFEQLKPTKQIHYIVVHPILFLEHVVSSFFSQDWFSQFFGLLGWNYIYIPGSVIALLSVVIVVAGLYKDTYAINYTKKLLLVSSVVSSIICAFLIVLNFYITFNLVGSPKVEGVQGRYFIPLAAFFVYGSCALMPIKISMSSKTAKILFSSVSFLSLTISAIFYYHFTY